MIFRQVFLGRRSGQSMFLLILVAIIFVGGLVVASNFIGITQARFSSISSDEQIAITLAEGGINLADASIRDRINNLSGDWESIIASFGDTFLAGVYRPIILSLFVDLPMKNNYMQECEDLEQELNELMPPWKIDVKYRFSGIMPLGGNIAIGTIIKRWMPYINLEKQGTIEIIATAYNPDTGMKRMVAVEKEFKVIDLTPPCSHYSFVFDSAVPLATARPFFFGSGSAEDERNAANVKLAASNDVDDPDALLNGSFEPFPLSTKGYLSIESWDLGQILNIENFKPGEAFLKTLFLPKGRVMLRGKGSPKICKNANIVEWLSNVKPQQFYFTLDNFYFEFPTKPLIIDIKRLLHEFYGEQVGQTVFEALNNGAIWNIRIPARVDFPTFSFSENMINDFFGVVQIFTGGNYPAKRTLGGEPAINENLVGFSQEILRLFTGMDVSLNFSPEFSQMAQNLESLDLANKTEEAINMIQALYGEKGGIDNYDIWEFLMAPYGKGSITTNPSGAISKPDKMGSTTLANGWALPVLFRNNGHFWGCLIDPASAISGLMEFSPKELAGDISTNLRKGAEKFEKFKTTAMKSMDAAKGLGDAAKNRDFNRSTQALKELTQLSTAAGEEISTDLNAIAEGIALNPTVDGGVSVVLNTFLNLVPRDYLESAQKKIVGDISGIKIVNCLLFPRMEGRIYSGWYQMSSCPTGYWTDLNAVGIGVAGVGGGGTGAAGAGSAGTAGGTVVPGIGNGVGAAGGAAGGGVGGGGTAGGTAAAGEAALGFPFNIPLPVPSAQGMAQMMTLISIELMADAYMLARECGPNGKGVQEMLNSFGSAAETIGDAVKNFFNGEGDLLSKVRDNSLAILAATDGPVKYIQYFFMRGKTFLEIFINGFMKSMRPYHKFSNGDDLTPSANGQPIPNKSDDLDEYLTDPQNTHPPSADKPLANSEPLPMDAYKDRASRIIEGNLTISGETEIWGLWYVTGKVNISNCSITGMGMIAAENGFVVNGSMVHSSPGYDFISLVTDKTISVNPSQGSFAGLHAAVYAGGGVTGKPENKLKIYGNLVVKELAMPDYRPRIAVVFDSGIVNKPRNALAWFMPWNKVIAVVSDRAFNYRVYAK